MKIKKFIYACIIPNTKEIKFGLFNDNNIIKDILFLLYVFLNNIVKGFNKCERNEKKIENKIIYWKPGRMWKNNWIIIFF